MTALKVHPNREAIQVMRVHLGLTRGDLAREAGLSPSYMWRIETGECVPRISTLKRIADAMSRVGGREIPLTMLLTTKEPSAEPPAVVAAMLAAGERASA